MSSRMPDASSGGNVEGNGVRSSRRIAGRRDGLAPADGGSDDGDGAGAGSVPRTFIVRKYGSTLAGLSEMVHATNKERGIRRGSYFHREYVQTESVRDQQTLMWVNEEGGMSGLKHTVDCNE